MSASPASVQSQSITQLAINTIRTLSMDAVQQANSGHPGTPMALAPVVYSLWSGPLRYDPAAPLWPARDRFVLSCGHASMLLYSVLHLAGVTDLDASGQPVDRLAITLDDIKRFRQLHSRCAGHPEFNEAPGIETTTGPLGQGIADSVGMAIAARWFSARYDRPGFESFGFRTFALCSDGDLMEGVGAEAASLAGHLRLANLCWIYDDNHITIEGETELAFSENVGRRFEGLGWNVIRVADANDLTAIGDALAVFENTSAAPSAPSARPTLIIVRSVIGYGAPNKANTHGAHGAPLGADEVRLTKEVYGWPADEKFVVPEDVREHFAAVVGERGERQRRAWQASFDKYAKQFPSQAAELSAIWKGELPAGWDKEIPVFPADAKGLATRVSSGKVLNAVAKNFPWLIGGSADLAPSTMTTLEFPEAQGSFSAENHAGRNFHFGIREHAMAAACNGLALCGVRPYGATFFVFSDYLRPAMRLSSIMRQGVIYIFTHDSIGLGEDGPTHQPIEHLSACRAIPGLQVIRPGDANEVAEVYRTLLKRTKQPAALVLSRQNLPTVDRQKYRSAADVARGGYILADAPGSSPGSAPEVILIATGSELPICVDAHEKLLAAGVHSRLVSMPCCEWFEEQDEAYRESVLPASVTARVVVEAGVRQCWDRYLGPRGQFVGMSSFGASAPYQKLYEHFGITADNVVKAAKAVL